MAAGALNEVQEVRARPAGRRTGPARVLLVDDSRAVRTLVRLYLAARGHEFLEAGTAEEALAQLGREPVDLIITDYNMPGLKGLAFTEAVRAHALPSVCALPVLMLTSEANAPELRRQASAAGVSAFLRKPVTGPELASVVEGLLGTRRV